jgi:hypothetical protein
MTLKANATKAQERRWYRYAVQLSLEQFYGKSGPEASRLVRGWWKRLSESGSLDSDLFLHAEPLNTAAGIAQMKAIAITDSNRGAYHRLLDRSRDLVLARGGAEVRLLNTKPTAKKASQRQEVAFG